MTEVCAVLITAPDAKWLKSLVRNMVTDRLCAVGHVSPVSTTYRWEGEVHEADEALATLRTVPDRVPEIIARTQREHPYKVPSIITMPITDATPAYRTWIIEQSSPL
ncbi:divalent-cation tolerance protein CutA [Streptomyces sp. NBC_01381]|uniref:divalent-cation tolerance protein CutA n=1 Tax=Streptomyces sp. NBC_01381 TaxID=2903845 RepID=UPI002253B3B1|nr:divalent-cation tolerance protein CutA [Streptomyces sp. NBC_01381]MCX4672859.1 divalent-cation tolerance protein CutA [Streptomyces sp. NBC_01381]